MGRPDGAESAGSCPDPTAELCLGAGWAPGCSSGAAAGEDPRERAAAEQEHPEDEQGDNHEATSSNRWGLSRDAQLHTGGLTPGEPVLVIFTGGVKQPQHFVEVVVQLVEVNIQHLLQQGGCFPREHKPRWLH